MAEELRAHKDALGSLVSLENGKIKAEGDGEVQEMIDIADFAVGQSRMLYGLAMHSERPQHRMYEQWHPLGVVGIISAFNFPVAVWSWNAFLAAICGNVSVWKPSPKTPLCAIAVQEICNRVLTRHQLPPIFQLFIDARQRARRALHRRSARGAGLLHRLHRGRPQGRRARRGASRQEPAGARRQQRDHRRRVGQSRSRRACDRLRRGGHGRPALHQHAPRVRAPRAPGRAREAAAARLHAGEDRRSAGTGHLVGPLIDRQAVARFEAALARVREQGGEILCGGRVSAGSGQLRRAGDRACPQRLADRADRDLRADPVRDPGAIAR